MTRLLISLIVLLNSLNLSKAKEIKAEENLYISFDLDETLIQSNHLTKERLEKARGLNYQIQSTSKGQDYIVRPGAIELLDWLKAQGFELMIFTHNYYNYAVDILEHSSLDKYFSKIKAHEDVVKSYNHDYTLYPQHRNITYPQSSILRTYTIGLFNGMVRNAFIRAQGNKNIFTYLPCHNCAKYPPLYGARVHIDNSSHHINEPLDFFGILVEDFDADRLEEKDANGNYLWAENLKNDLVKLKTASWIDLYIEKYGKEPVVNSVYIQN